MSPDTCKHYTGDHRNTHCKAGVCYKDVTTGKASEPGGAYRKPCIDWIAFGKKRGHSPLTPAQMQEWSRRGSCAKFELPTKEEVQKYEDEMRAHMKKVMVALEFVQKLKEQHAKSWGGVEECPVCKGKLHIRINVFFSEYQNEQQKHAHVRCETEDCVQWME